MRVRSLLKLVSVSMLVKKLRNGEKYAYEVITPIISEMIMAEATYNNFYKAIYDISRKGYGDISQMLRYCLKKTLNGKDIQMELNLALKKYPELMSSIAQLVQSNREQTADLEKTLLLFRILESKARRKYQEYTLKLNSIISIFFFYIFLIPTPIILTSSLLPQVAYILFPLFFTSNVVIFKFFFNKIGRIRSILLG